MAMAEAEGKGRARSDGRFCFLPWERPMTPVQFRAVSCPLLCTTASTGLAQPRAALCCQPKSAPKAPMLSVIGAKLLGTTSLATVAFWEC
jgi:hypothetical protein